ncbi:MAG: mucin-like protein [Planctomycetaceae bacterium]|nr:mucin-like protein [Planctomycetaceae bacterium]
MPSRLRVIAVLAYVLGFANQQAAAQWPTPDLYRLPPASSSAPGATPQVARLPANSTPTPPEEIDITELPASEEPTTWMMPSYWINPVDWEGGVEIGLNGTEGNAEALSLRTGANIKRKSDIYDLTADFTYLKATADGVESQHNALQNAGFERKFADTPWSLFLKEALEYDEFKAFDLRLALNGGIGYQWIKTETTSLNGRFGAGVSHEFGGPSDEWVPEAVYGFDYERKLTERQKLALKMDYFPEWRNPSNYRLVTDFGWEVLLDETHNLNLKLSVNDRYDSTPNGRRPNDVNYSLLLLWKL